MSDTFNEDVKELGLLAFNAATIDDFTDHYQQMLENLFNSALNQVVSIETYTERLQALKGVLCEQIRYLGGEPPARKVN